MKALLLKAPNTRFEEVELPDPVAGPGEAVARVLACGSGLTIQHVKKGRMAAKFPAVIGHEITAEIGEVVNDGSTTLFLPPQANPLSGKLEGQISRLDIENSLRFNNALTVLTTTAAGLKELVEHAVAATAPGATPGQFPQIGGMAFSFDPTRQARTSSVPGQRVRSLVVGQGASADVVVFDGEVVGDPTRPIRVVTLSFLADPSAPGSPNGGDNYPFPAYGENKVALASAAPGASLPNTATFAAQGTEQDAMAEYLRAFRRSHSDSRVILVLAMMRDKEHRGFIEPFQGLVDEVVLTQADLKRSATVEELLPVIAAVYPQVHVQPRVQDALNEAGQLARPQDMICVTGSLMLVGEVKASLRGCGLSPLRG